MDVDVDTQLAGIRFSQESMDTDLECDKLKIQKEFTQATNQTSSKTQLQFKHYNGN